MGRCSSNGRACCVDKCSSAAVAWMTIVKHREEIYVCDKESGQMRETDVVRVISLSSIVYVMAFVYTVLVSLICALYTIANRIVHISYVRANCAVFFWHETTSN